MTGTGGAMRARGRRATALPFQQLRRGALMASLAEPQGEPVDSDGHARLTCGVLDLRQQLVRRPVWQWTVAGGRRRWFVGGDRTAARIRRRGPPQQRCDQHDTRRHPTTSVSSWNGGRRLHWFRSCSEIGRGDRLH